MYRLCPVKCHMCIIIQHYHLVMAVPALCQTKVRTVDFVHCIIYVPYISDSLLSKQYI
jgi:hypothetical protein